jgi:hypothetical protein
MTEIKAVTSEDVNDIAELADKCDNILAATKIPMPQGFHLDRVRSFLLEASNELKRFYAEHSGEDPWQDASPFADDGGVDGA